MKDRKTSNVVALAVTLLAVVTAVSFSLATAAYYREVLSLRQKNAEYVVTLDRYKQALKNIQKQLAATGLKVQ